MRKIQLLPLLFLFVAFSVAPSAASAFETANVWPGVAPGANEEGKTAPTYELWQPAQKTTDACLIVCPGGSYIDLAYDYEGQKIAEYFNRKGVTVVILKYRVPRREGVAKHLPAWQDAQRTVRVVRSNAEKWGINPNKIGIMGFSAGGHLTLMTSTTSETNSYEPKDEIDQLPCNVNFAVPVYPAYVLEAEADEEYVNTGHDMTMVKDFAFDAHTPPMCLIHGDADVVSPLNSVAVYHKLRTMNIPAELHIFAKVNHGFGGNPTDDHIGDWLNRVYAWMKVMGL